MNLTVLPGGKAAGTGSKIGELAATAFMATPPDVQLEQIRAANRNVIWWTIGLGSVGFVGCVLLGNSLAKRGGCRAK